MVNCDGSGYFCQYIKKGWDRRFSENPISEAYLILTHTHIAILILDAFKLGFLRDLILSLCMTGGFKIQ